MFDNYGNNHAQVEAANTAQNRKVLRFDKNYVKTLPGILKLVEVLSNIAGFICIKVSSAFLSPIFYNLVYWIGNCITLLLLLVYTIHFVEKFDQWPWHKLEFFFCLAIVLAYIATSIFATTLAESVGYAVGFFGLCAIIAYGLDGYLCYKGWKRGLPPQ